MSREYNVRSQCDTDGNPEYIWWGVHGWTENREEAYNMPWGQATYTAERLRAQSNTLEGKFYNVTVLEVEHG